jgi:hypothetical protein
MVRLDGIVVLWLVGARHVECAKITDWKQLGLVHKDPGNSGLVSLHFAKLKKSELGIYLYVSSIFNFEAADSSFVKANVECVVFIIEV